MVIENRLTLYLVVGIIKVGLYLNDYIEKSVIMSKLEVNFSENLKKLRKENKITQKALADQIGCSEKTVSKWECALSIPDIEVLFSVAKVFNTNVESLFSSEDAVYFLGIDGGGTKTHMILTDVEGNEIKSVIADCCNPMDIGVEKAKKVLKDAIYEICENVPFTSVVTFAGIAGGTSAGMKEVFQEFFKRFNFKACNNDSDNRNIIAAGLGDRDGITLILGTGVCSFLQHHNHYRMAGGKGYLIDNGGSAYNIGRDGLHAYFCEKDGMKSPTEITKEIEKLNIGTPQDVVKTIYNGGKKVIASFAKTVYDAARKGDKTADEILKRNMCEAAKLVDTLAQELKQDKIPLVVAGGLTKDELTIQYLKKAFDKPEQYMITVLDREPVEGAVMLARKLYEAQKEG